MLRLAAFVIVMIALGLFDVGLGWALLQSWYAVGNSLNDSQWNPTRQV